MSTTSPSTKNDPAVVAKIMRAIASGTNAKDAGHDIALIIAAELLEEFAILKRHTRG